MKSLRRNLLILSVSLLAALPAIGQEKQRVSPHETISAVFNGDRVTLIYGRPYSKDPKTGETRKIWGTLIPYGKIWRTGADEAVAGAPSQVGPRTCTSAWTVCSPAAGIRFGPSAAAPRARIGWRVSR